jgi:NAD(P)-dependent dehydrogenase (short-subunit alcohol dehydrogenase family)
MSMFSLAGKTAVVTGAGSGIGKSIALTFAKQGAHVEVFDLNEEAARAVAEEIKTAGGSADHQTCDVADTTQAAAAIDRVWTKRGKLDILVNNAGIAHVGNVLNTSEEDLDRIYRVNVKGVANCTKAGVEKMVAQGGGVILNMCSIAAQMGIADRFAYSMSKGAVLAMTYSVAQDYMKHDVRCNAICPGRIQTPFVDGFIKKNYPGREAEMFEKLSKTQPIGRMGQPDEVAAAAVFLCSDEASFITGTAYPVDGGSLYLR